MRKQNPDLNSEGGFTLIEVAIASVISMISLMFLATLFTLALFQNKHSKQSASALAVAQAKMENLETVQPSDAKLTIGGGPAGQGVTLAQAEAGKQAGYWDQVWVNETTGAIVTATSNGGAMPNYNRYWNIQKDPDPNFVNAVIITVYVTATSAQGGLAPDQATLVTERSTQ